MIKKFYIFEKSLYSDLTEIDIDKDEEKLKDLIGFDSKDYDLLSIDNKKIKLAFSENFLSDLFYIERGALRYALSIGTYGWDYNIDSSEIEYIYSYFSSENRKEFNKLANLLDLNINSESVEYVAAAFFNVLDNVININDILYEISDAQSDSIILNRDKLIDNLPILIDSHYSRSSKFDVEIEFDIEKIGQYIEQHNLENIDTIKDFLENVDFSVFDYENLQNTDDAKYNKVSLEIQKELEKLTSEFEIYKSIFDATDADQLSLFDEDEIEIKTKKYHFKYGIFSKLDINDIDDAKIVGGKILAWFKSYDFQKNYMINGGVSLLKYKKLIEDEIINPQIEKEYNYLEGQEQYNI